MDRSRGERADSLPKNRIARLDLSLPARNERGESRREGRDLQPSSSSPRPSPPSCVGRRGRLERSLCRFKGSTRETLLGQFSPVPLPSGTCLARNQSAGVAQIFNLPYRRFSIGKVYGPTKRLACSRDLQNAILRYGRVELCATLNRYTLGGERESAPSPRDRLIRACPVR